MKQLKYTGDPWEDVFKEEVRTTAFFEEPGAHITNSTSRRRLLRTSQTHSPCLLGTVSTWRKGSKLSLPRTASRIINQVRCRLPFFDGPWTELGDVSKISMLQAKAGTFCSSTTADRPGYTPLTSTWLDSRLPAGTPTNHVLSITYYLTS